MLTLNHWIAGGTGDAKTFWLGLAGQVRGKRVTVALQSLL
jgi:hypothetical protein